MTPDEHDLLIWHKRHLQVYGNKHLGSLDMTRPPFSFEFFLNKCFSPPEIQLKYAANSERCWVNPWIEPKYGPKPKQRKIVGLDFTFPARILNYLLKKDLFGVEHQHYPSVLARACVFYRSAMPLANSVTRFFLAPFKLQHSSSAETVMALEMFKAFSVPASALQRRVSQERKWATIRAATVIFSLRNYQQVWRLQSGRSGKHEPLNT